MKEDYTIMKSRYKGFCYECNFTIWKNEEIKFSGKARHLNCFSALKDETPRTLNPAYSNKVGKISKKKMINILKTRVKGYSSAKRTSRRGTSRNKDSISNSLIQIYSKDSSA